MSRTTISASERDVQITSERISRLHSGHRVLALASLVAMSVLGLAYVGKLGTSSLPGSEQTSRLTNLNTVTDSKALGPLIERVFANPGDRRVAAAGMFSFILSLREAGEDLPNAGVLARATVKAAEIDQASPPASEYRERLRAARANASQKGQAAPSALPLLTPTQLATLKPFIVVRSSETFARQLLFWSALYLISFWAVIVLWRLFKVRGDFSLVVAAHLLTAIGFAALVSRGDPLRDTLLFARYAQACIFGAGLFGLVSLIDFRRAAFLRLSYVPLVGAFLLSLLLIVFGSGPGNSGAKVNLGPVQPVEAIRLLLAFFLAGYFARRWELLRQIDGNTLRGYRLPRWLHFPRLDYLMPVLAGVATSLVFFFLQKDLGPALFVACVFLVVYTVARNRTGLAAIGLTVLGLGFYLGYALNISSTLAGRVQMWLSPWDNSVRGGDQIAQSVWSLSSGGLFGTGLGLGDTRYLPAGHTDLILPAIGEELGFIGILLIAAVYAVIALRGFRAARSAANDYGFFLATVMTLFLIVPVLIMVAGGLGVIPLTGVVTPFLSYGGSAMLANFLGLGILSAIGSHAAVKSKTAEPFLKPLRYLTQGLSVAAVALLVLLFNVQVLSADGYVVKPHLSLQADGGRRFQYNQRVLEIARLLPRGTIYDRRGLALATSSEEVALKARADYKKAGIVLDSTCMEPSERCYPLGGAAFHLLGDARTRSHWSATNTSFVERDAENTLRGFNDDATLVASTDSSGDATRIVRRDYQELVPLLRHRHQPEHSSWQKFLGRPRDITLTIDARLQARVSAILSRYAGKSPKGRGAAVVINPDTGELLAAVSYPFPSLPARHDAETAEDNDALLDRARYGLYPPGSTFKLVTAAAALRHDMNLSHKTFTCSGLPNGRVGARVANWGVVRDDVLEKHPHGTIDMHDGLVHSCNAYFAQLAVRVGPEALLETASRLGISVSPANSAQQLRETLPQAGYGQGYVVTTPLRMARVTAAIASRGTFREIHVDSRATAQAAGEHLITPEAARLLGQYMRDAVTKGTGRTLRNHSGKIAGKTGTAEVKGMPSHAWFVGFAPYGQEKKKIAFAVVIENAGYGGQTAAPVAGEIVSAATALGLVD